MLNHEHTHARIEAIFSEHEAVLQDTRSLVPQIERVANLLVDCLESGGKILLCGNGGSASDAQHLAGEFVGRFLLDRAAYPAIALHTDTTILTAVANDYGYDVVYERQVDALGQAGDVLIGLTTSGNSANILKAVASAKKKGMKVVGFTGMSGGKLAAECDECFCIPSMITARIQEMHIMIGHALCELSEAHLANQK